MGIVRCIGMIVLLPFSQAVLARADDSEWEQVLAIRDSIRSSSNGTREGHIALLEESRREFRAAGWHFYLGHSSDPRVWDWLKDTLAYAPSYADDNTDAEAAWEFRMAQVLKPALLVTPSVSADLRLSIFAQELHAVFRKKGFNAEKRNMKVDAVALANAVAEFARYCPDDAATVKQYANMLISFSDRWQISKAARELVIDVFKRSPNHSLRAFAVEWSRLLKLQSEPLELCLWTLDGRKISLGALRGKVVLLDFWSTTCPSCLEGMKEIMPIYARYQQRGFEVVGICFAEDSERAKVEKLVEKLQVPWSQSLQPDGLNSPLAHRFAITGVPVTYLLDQQGLTVTTNIKGDQLAEEVRRLLEMHDAR